MNRYSKYTLQSALDLTDGLCRYLIQDRCWGPQEILDAEAVVYDFQSEAEQMLWDCLSYGDPAAIGRLRYFLAEDCRVHFVHRMDDRRVVRETARQLTHYGHQVVLEPGLGWAVQVDAATAAPVVPVAVEPEPEVDSALADLKGVLDELVGEQRKKYAQYEAKLATLSEADKAALYGQKAGAGLWEATIGGAVGLVKALPGFAAGYFKTLCKIAMLPSELATATARSLATGDMAPLKAEADKFVQPLVKTYDQSVYYKSMLVTLYEDEQTMGLLNDFANDYWDATHPLERTEMGASAAADIVVTILLALVTAGVGAAASIAAKSTRLAKAAKLLDKIAGMLKRTGHRNRMPKKEAASSIISKGDKMIPKKKKNGMAEPHTSKADDVCAIKKGDNEHSPKDKIDRPTTVSNGYQARTSPKIAQSVLDKIDPSRFSPDTRFGKAFYVAEKGDVAVAEVAYHGSTPTHVIRYKMDLSKAKVLDLTDPTVVKDWGSPGGNNYAKTQAIAKKAQESGYNVIKFPSQRATGDNLAIFDNFDEILTPQMITPVPK